MCCVLVGLAHLTVSVKGYVYVLILVQRGDESMTLAEVCVMRGEDSP